MTTNNLSFIEDENHVLLHCPNGANIREKLKSKMNNLGDLAIDDFHMAQTYPSNLPDDRGQNDTFGKIIRYSCNTIQRLYSNVLKYKKELADRRTAAAAGV